MGKVIRTMRRTPPPEEIEGHDGYDGDPNAPIGIPHYNCGGSGGSGGLGEYNSGGHDVYNGI